MDKKSKILFIALSVSVALSVFVSYYRIFIAKDYIIEAQTECDPSVEACFVAVCDPVEEECSENPQEDILYYKILQRKAANIPLCDPKEEGCRALLCEEGEVDCSEILCDSANAEEEVVCSDPANFQEITEDAGSESECDDESGECSPITPEKGSSETGTEEAAQIPEEGDLE
jgi:hypothetical protein